jgi:hypothetical protein
MEMAALNARRTGDDDHGHGDDDPSGHHAVRLLPRNVSAGNPALSLTSVVVVEGSRPLVDIELELTLTPELVTSLRRDDVHVPIRACRALSGGDAEHPALSRKLHGGVRCELPGPEPPQNTSAPRASPCSHSTERNLVPEWCATRCARTQHHDNHIRAMNTAAVERVGVPFVPTTACCRS